MIYLFIPLFTHLHICIYFSPPFIDLHLSLNLSLSVVHLSSPASLSPWPINLYLLHLSPQTSIYMSLYHIRLRNCLSTEGCVSTCIDVLQITHTASSMVLPELIFRSICNGIPDVNFSSFPFQADGGSNAANDAAMMMMQKFWDSALALDPPAADDDDAMTITPLIFSFYCCPEVNALLLFSFEFGYFLHLLHLKSTTIHPSRKSRKRNKDRFPLHHGKRAECLLFLIFLFLLMIVELNRSTINRRSIGAQTNLIDWGVDLFPINLDRSLSSNPRITSTGSNHVNQIPDRHSQLFPYLSLTLSQSPVTHSTIGLNGLQWA